MSCNLADDVSRDLVDVLEKRRVDTSLVTMEGLGGDTCHDARLGWGEVTPLWFLSEARGTSGTRKRVLPQVCHPIIQSGPYKMQPRMSVVGCIFHDPDCTTVITNV